MLVWAVVGDVDRDVPDVVRGVCERVGDVVGDVADPGQRLVPASPGSSAPLGVTASTASPAVDNLADDLWITIGAPMVTAPGFRAGRCSGAV
jgi:hypothetical protein